MIGHTGGIGLSHAQPAGSTVRASVAGRDSRVNAGSPSSFMGSFASDRLGASGEKVLSEHPNYESFAHPARQSSLEVVAKFAVDL